MAATGHEYEMAVAKLEELARRRVEHQAAGQALAEEVRAAARAAQEVMPTSEIARRLEIDRSTLYRIYLDG